jgi:hypothetical protein
MKSSGFGRVHQMQDVIIGSLSPIKVLLTLNRLRDAENRVIYVRRSPILTRFAVHTRNQRGTDSVTDYST